MSETADEREDPCHPDFVAPLNSPRKVYCICDTYCERKGRPFPAHWRWKCKELPTEKSEAKR